jgi:hypothetical protein
MSLPARLQRFTIRMWRLFVVFRPIGPDRFALFDEPDA